MSIQDDIRVALREAGVQAYAQVAPQPANAPFTVYRRADSIPTQTIGGETVIQRSDFTFFCVGADAAAAFAQRELTRAAIVASDTLKEQYAFEIPSGEAEYEPDTNQAVEPCAFSFWHV